ncbi:hypothetical protein RDWZM_008678 [Blomia tropicalis]|uniref:Uncharacterized protein n=1 Tax=Blomia tropicalis TaxID=40697 RepID=A0A9Q0RKB4_BLOTA|nr:hypothetical protein RDWZM_008678 [Blomia tropicalis]
MDHSVQTDGQVLKNQAKTIKMRKKWTPEEDTNLIELIKIHGLKWTKIANYMKGRNGQQCAGRWNNVLDPKILKGSWTSEEDEKLEKLIKKYGSKWSIIAQNMGNRSSLQCRDRWNLLLNKKNNESKRDWTSEEDKKLLELVKEHGNNWKKITKETESRTWTPEEDTNLIELIKLHGPRWTTIAKHMKSRNVSQCFRRWNFVLDPKIFKGSWTPEEDEKLRKLMEKYGSKWSIIAQNMGNRSSLQCRSRWNSLQNKKNNVSKKDWTPEEDTNLIELVKLHGPRWTTIAKHMKSRNVSQCIRRWKYTLDPKILKGSWTPEEDEKLRKLIKKYGSKWSIIAQNMGNRSLLQCWHHWKHLLNKKNEWTPEEDKKLSELVKEYGNNWKKISENMNERSINDCWKKYHMHLNSNIRKGKWTPSEDKMLKDLVEKFGTRWDKIADCMKNRNYIQCHHRWNNTFNSINKPWTLKEDQMLINLVKVYGLNWKEISENIDDRTSYQCCVRWSECLDPKIIKGRWSLKEDKQLDNLVRKFGTKFAKISKLMDGRTRSQCANRWGRIKKFKNESFVEFSDIFSDDENPFEDESSQQTIEIDYDSDPTIIDLSN